MIAPGILPPPRSGGHQPQPRAQQGGDVLAGSDLQDEVQFAQFFHHQEDALPQLLRQKGQPDISRVLVSIADDGRARRVQHRQRRVQFGLGSHLQPHAVPGAKAHHGFHHLALLVDLHGIDPLKTPLVAMCGAGRREGLVKTPHPVLQNVRKPDQQGQGEAPGHRVVHQRLDVHTAAGRARRFTTASRRKCRAGALPIGEHGHMSLGIDPEVSFSPTVDVVQFLGIGEGPSFQIGHHAPR